MRDCKRKYWLGGCKNFRGSQKKYVDVYKYKF